MKCENCGKEEVSFHYTSNINGNITEKHLCADCAVKLGFDKKPESVADGPDEAEKSFEEIFAELFGFTPNRRMLAGYGLVFPTFIIPTVGVLVPGERPAQALEPKPETALVKPAIDEEMKKRREINVMREQMRQAAEAEDFEKAAELRDAIKKLENGVNS